MSSLVAEVVFPAAENIVVDLMKILNLDAKEVTVRTLSAQGESEDSCTALIPSDLLRTPAQQHPRTMSKCKPLASAGMPDTKDDHNEKRNLFSERSNAVHDNSDEEEDGYDSPHIKRKGASVDEFLKGSELGKQPHYCPGDDYHTESSRGSDLSDILEEDEEELYSEMQLEDGGRRRVSVTSHNTLK
ncbi:unnamed protein product, partial [Ranitomeya imitator]